MFAAEPAAPTAPAPAAAKVSEEDIIALAKAQIEVKMQILAIMGSDKTEAEKLEAILAMFPECRSIGSKALDAGMARVLRKAQEINLPTQDDRVRFAHWREGVGYEDKAIRQAIEDATNLSKGLPTHEAIVSMTPEQIADAFLGTMQTCTNKMLHDDLTNQERIDYLAEMQHRLAIIYIWIKDTGKAAEVTTILKSRYGVRNSLRNQSVISQLSLGNDATLARAALDYLIALDGLSRILYPEF